MVTGEGVGASVQPSEDLIEAKMLKVGIEERLQDVGSCCARIGMLWVEVTSAQPTLLYRYR
jgi:hypothetical protein